MSKHNEYQITYDVQVNTNEHLSQCDSKDIMSVNSDKWISMKKMKEIVDRECYKNSRTSIIRYISSASGKMAKFAVQSRRRMRNTSCRF